MASPFLIAHRGVPAQSPENSALSFQMALDACAPAIEMDLRPTADGLLVVLHDKTPERLTGEKACTWQLPAEKLLSLAYSAAPDQKILLLDEALAMIADRALLVLEVKPGGVSREDLLSRLLEALERAGSPQNLVVTSEDRELIRLLGEQAPLMRTGIVHRFHALGDAVEQALSCRARIITANAQRVTRALVDRAREAGIAVWAYTAQDFEHAKDLFELGCEAVFTDDFPQMQPALERLLAPSPALATPETVAPTTNRTVLAIDVGSSSTKVALIDPSEGIFARESLPTPVHSSERGRVEHDPERLIEVLEQLLGKLARVHPVPPSAAALACQRSTGLWAQREGLTPQGFAFSWRDERGLAICDHLQARREELEAEAGLPLSAAWTALKGKASLDDGLPAPGTLLLPLATWLAARLTHSAPRVDPTLGNRTFLQHANGTDWSPLLLEAFGFSPEHLPERATTLDLYGELNWPAGGRVPLHCVIGDQQAAYIGAAGPMGQRLVLNLGTAGFAMRRAGVHESVPAGAYRSPLWTSRARPIPGLFLIEIPVLSPETRTPRTLTSAESSREVARKLALAQPELLEFIDSLRSAVAKLSSHRDRSVLVAGGVLESPHLFHRLETDLTLPALAARESELTLLGAARLASSAAGFGWAVPDGGGVREDRRLWL